MEFVGRSCIEKFFTENPFVENQRETLGYVIADMRQEWREDIEKKVSELRKEIESLRSGVKGSNIELVKRSKDVA